LSFRSGFALPSAQPRKTILTLIVADGTTCMCAQGQALHYIGGWNFARLRKTSQAEADQATAYLLDISRAHAILLRIVNDDQPAVPSAVLTDPERILGNNALAVLAFWRHLDRMSASDWAAVDAAISDGNNCTNAIQAVAAAAHADAAGQADQSAAADTADNATAMACFNARQAVWADGVCVAASCATNEIQTAEIMAERGQPLFFLRAFGFPTAASVLAAAGVSAQEVGLSAR